MLLKKRLSCRCFPVNFGKFSRTSAASVSNTFAEVHLEPCQASNMGFSVKQVHD